MGSYSSLHVGIEEDIKNVPVARVNALLGYLDNRCSPVTASLLRGLVWLVVWLGSIGTSVPKYAFLLHILGMFLVFHCLFYA